ncbi:MAG: nucleotidyltransferase family protein [SAR324 cluster bacterium]|nr:nucleotidyltransferase family protein [SAR324 cluster bacterium]
MKAMILAAGKGTRLQPITLSLPKALVPVDNIPALEWTIQRLKYLGVTSVILNTHYLADQIKQYLKNRPVDGLKIETSHEEEILGTGGGLLKTHDFWDDSPFFLHNADIFCNADLKQAYQYHLQAQNLATLCVQERETQTRLLVDESGFLCGIHYYKKDLRVQTRPPEGKVYEAGFSGIHVISPSIFPVITESGSFSCKSAIS